MAATRSPDDNDEGENVTDNEQPNEAQQGVAGVSRRNVLKSFGAGAAAIGAGRVIAPGAHANRSLGNVSRGRAAGGNVIKIGYVTPETGSLADFSQSDIFILDKVRSTSQYAKGIKIGGKTYKIEISVLDSQSSPNTAAQVAQKFALQDKVDLVVTSSAPETTNPVASTCQELHVPNLATVVPWEAWYGGLGGNPGKPTKSFEYSSMFFFGLEEFGGTFLPMWDRVRKMTGADKIYAAMFPNDSDGNAFQEGWPPQAAAQGYTEVFGGAYTDGTTNYSSMIEKFKAGNCDFFVNAPLPPDFNTFWKQAAQQAFKPKLATVAKVLLFPSDVTALGSLVTNIATDAWWTPWGPYKSSLTGETAKQFALDYENLTKRQWVQSMGSAYSLFEVAAEAFQAVDDPHDKAQVAAALHKVNYSGMCGPIDFGAGPAPGVGIIKPVGIQWKPSKQWGYAPFVVDNSLNKHIPINGDLEPTNP
jgi:branched-chain amino acid transport system substrate-binding protein